MYKRIINGVKRWVKDLIVGDGSPGSKSLIFSNNFLSYLRANPSTSRTWELPDKTGALAIVALDVNNSEGTPVNMLDVGSNNGLKSAYYLLGTDCQFIPVGGGQSIIRSFWDLQLGGIRGTEIYNSSYQTKYPFPASNIGYGAGKSCVIISPASDTNISAYPGNLDVNNFRLLHLLRQTWQTGGWYLDCSDANLQRVFSVAVNGSIFTKGTIALGAYINTSLPTNNIVNGTIAWCSNSCKLGEATGAGTGTLVVYTQNTWKNFDYTTIQV